MANGEEIAYLPLAERTDRPQVAALISAKLQVHGARAVVGIAAALAILFLLARLLLAAEGDVSKFVVAGNVHTRPVLAAQGVHVFGTDGYDGQYYWRLATNPTVLSPKLYRGVEFDSVLRDSRIGYPTIAYLVAFGNTAWVKWSLVAVNLLALLVLAFAGVSLSRSFGRPALFGLLLASASGLVMALSRDLCEVTMMAALVAGIAAMAQRRHGLATVCWVIACLTHEQALLCVLPYGAYRLVQLARQRSWRPGAADLPWLAGAGAFAAWQIVCRVAVGSFPVRASGGASLDLPFRGLVEQGRHWLAHGMARQEVLVVPQVALLVALVVVAFRSASTMQQEFRWLRWALIGAAVLAASLSKDVWVGPAELRQFVVLSTIAWLVIIASRRPIPALLVVGSAAVWVMTAALRSVAV